MQNLYLTEMEYEKDMDRMKELYPKEVKQITELVDEECDKMEYEGSLMFDEYPDRMMLERVTDRIYQRMQEKENSLTAEQYYGPPPLPPPPGRNDPMYGLIGVMLSNEMYRRRCRHRRCRRWW